MNPWKTALRIALHAYNVAFDVCSGEHQTPPSSIEEVELMTAQRMEAKARTTLHEISAKALQGTRK